MVGKVSPKLTPITWMRAAFQELSRGGVAALKVEVLAKRLKTTKGSFYWHFKDVQTFKLEMLKLWEVEATKAVMIAVEVAAPQGRQRLQALTNIISQMNAENNYGGLRAEPAIREWARIDAVAATAMQKVDAARIAFVKKLFIEIGCNASDAKQRAEVFYCGFLGFQTIASIKPFDLKSRMELLLKLLLT